MTITPAIIEEFVEVYSRECGERIEPDEAEQTIRNLLTLYRPLYEWHYRRRQSERQTLNSGS